MKKIYHSKQIYLVALFLLFQTVYNTYTVAQQVVPVDTISDTLSIKSKASPRIVGAPGGVSDGLVLWLRADDLSSITFLTNSDNNAEVKGWIDQTNNTHIYNTDNVSYSGKSYPVYSEYDEKTNFHPAISFSASSYLAIASGPMSTNAPADFTSFIPYYCTDYNSNSRLYTHGFGGTNPRSSATRYPAMGFTPTAGAGRIRNDGGGQTNVNGTLRGFYPKSTALEMIHTHSAGTTSGAGYVRFNFGGYEQKISTTGRFGSGFKMAAGGTIGGASTADGSFQGLIPEIIFYERLLTIEEQEQINTYLGIKYGVTLDKDPTNPNDNYDYVLSDDSTIVWNGNSDTNKSYHNNIAGLVRDDNSLFINKAKSTTNEGIVGMMVQGHNVIGQGAAPSPQFTSDLSGLFWGDNNQTETVTYTNEDCFNFTSRTSRIWLVEKSNLQQMSVSIFAGPSGSTTYDNYLNDSFQAYLLIADNPTDFANKTFSQIIPGYFENGYHMFDYTFTKEYTYFSLAFEAKPGTCSTCTFEGENNFTLTRSNLGARRINVTTANNPVTKTNLATENTSLTIDAAFEIGTGTTRMSVTPVNKLGIVNLKSAGAANSTSKLTYTLSTPANVSFKIGGVDRTDIINVYGYCNDKIIYPSKMYKSPLIGRDSKKGYTYNLVGLGEADGNRKSIGRNNPRGIVNFDFDFAVEKIVIEYSSTKARNSSIDIYPMQFWCPAPLPITNEAGYSMQKQGTTTANICDVIDYKFTILNSNLDCDSTRVYFEDILPDGMTWLPNSLSFNTDLLDTKVEENGGSSIVFENNKMVIDSLILAGGGRQTIIRAQAIFTDNAAINQTYYNQSKITYQRKDNQQVESLLSTNANFTEGVSTDRRTPTTVSNDARSYDYITAQMQLKPSDCFKQNSEVEVTINVDNPNQAITDMLLEIAYNSNFQYKANSFKINGANVANAIESINGGDDSDPGYTEISGFTLPSNTDGSQTVITYTITVPGINNLESETVNGKPVYYPLDIGFDLSTEAEGGTCLDNAFINTQSDSQLPFCSSRRYVITNKNVTTKIKK